MAMVDGFGETPTPANGRRRTGTRQQEKGVRAQH